MGISKANLLVMVFLFSGATAAVAGGLFATLQSYITPDAFTFDLSVLFFIAILIGGRGSVLGPLLGAVLLTALPEFAAPLVARSTFLYAALLLVIVIALPGGIALKSVAAWVKATRVTNVRAPMVLDASQSPWPSPRPRGRQ